MQISLTEPPIVLSEKDYQKWQKFTINFVFYSQLNQRQRQDLVVKAQTKISRVSSKLTEIDSQLEFNAEISSLARQYLEWEPLEVLNR